MMAEVQENVAMATSIQQNTDSTTDDDKSSTPDVESQESVPTTPKKDTTDNIQTDVTAKQTKKTLPEGGQSQCVGTHWLCSSYALKGIVAFLFALLLILLTIMILQINQANHDSINQNQSQTQNVIDPYYTDTSGAEPPQINTAATLLSPTVSPSVPSKAKESSVENINSPVEATIGFHSGFSDEHDNDVEDDAGKDARDDAKAGTDSPILTDETSKTPKEVASTNDEIESHHFASPSITSNTLTSKSKTLPPKHKPPQSNITVPQSTEKNPLTLAAKQEEMYSFSNWATFGTAAHPAAPTVAPTVAPTISPTMSPTKSPTAAPTAPPTAPPSPAPTHYPTTLSPTTNYPTAPNMNDLVIFFNLRQYTAQSILGDVSTPQGLAYKWLSQNDLQITPENMYQRYALVVLDFALHQGPYDYDTLVSKLIAHPRRHECDWDGIVCANNTNVVIGINWSKRDLVGVINQDRIPEVARLLPSIEKLDLSQNFIGGSLDIFWNMPTLKHLFLFQNQFSGPIVSTSDEVGPSIRGMVNLEKLYLGYNQLTGTIPSPFIRGGNNLRFLILHHNKLSGSIPNGLWLRKVHYLDLGYNALTGTLPSDFTNATRLIRHIFLDHNQLEGSIPNSFGTLGNGRLKMVYVNDNQFTGTVPGDWGNRDSTGTVGFYGSFLEHLNLQNNNFDGIDPRMCDYSVYNNGRLVNLRADCDICECPSLCDAFC